MEWGEQKLVLDEQRHCLFHVRCRREGSLLGRLDLGTWAYRKQPIPEVTREPFYPVLHPEERTIWFAEAGLGDIWRLDPDSAQFTRIPAGGLTETDTQRSFLNSAYWNPLTGRLGCFGGYGWFAVHNWRWEFDATQGRWLNVEPNQPGREPRCRSSAWLLPAADGRRILLFGGHGNLTGRQDARDPGMPLFDGRFHLLGDLWSLDLATNVWSCLVPAPGLVLSRFWSACYLQALEAVVVMQARSTDAPFGTPAEVFIHRLGTDRGFIPLASRGEVPDGLHPGHLTALPGGRSLLAFQKAGIFELTLEV